MFWYLAHKWMVLCLKANELPTHFLSFQSKWETAPRPMNKLLVLQPQVHRNVKSVYLVGLHPINGVWKLCGSQLLFVWQNVQQQLWKQRACVLCTNTWLLENFWPGIYVWYKPSDPFKWGKPTLLSRGTGHKIITWMDMRNSTIATNSWDGIAHFIF